MNQTLPPTIDPNQAAALFRANLLLVSYMLLLGKNADITRTETAGEIIAQFEAKIPLPKVYARVLAEGFKTLTDIDPTLSDPNEILERGYSHLHDTDDLIAFILREMGVDSDDLSIEVILEQDENEPE